MALILYGVMRGRLKDSHSQISPERATDRKFNRMRASITP